MSNPTKQSRPSIRRTRRVCPNCLERGCKLSPENCEKQEEHTDRTRILTESIEHAINDANVLQGPYTRESMPADFEVEELEEE